MRNWTLALVCVLAAAAAYAQAPATPAGPPAAPAGPPPTGLVVGSGNFFSPIVERPGQGGRVLPRRARPRRPGRAGQRRHQSWRCATCSGLPDAQLRWQIGRPPAMRTGVEIVEITKAASKPLERRVQDSGAFMLIVFVRDLDATFARLKQLGAPVVTKGGAPIGLPAAQAAVPRRRREGSRRALRRDRSRPIRRPRRRRRRPPTSSPFACA